MSAAALAEHEAWRSGLRAELVTHSNETFEQVMARLELERPTREWRGFTTKRGGR